MTITNRKGGVGKTTTVVNLAAAWQATGRRVLVLDLDAQGHASWGLGRKAVSRQEASIHRLFREEAAEGPMIVASRLPGLDLVPAERSFEERHSMVKRDLLAQWIRQVASKSAYEVVLIDTPPVLGTLMINALHAADMVLVPFVPHFLGLDGVQQLVRLADYLRSSAEETQQQGRLLLLPVMVDKRLKQHREVIDAVLNQFGRERVLLPGIRNNIRIAEAFGYAQSVLEYAPESSGAEDYRNLVNQLQAAGPAHEQGV